MTKSSVTSPAVEMEPSENYPTNGGSGPIKMELVYMVYNVSYLLEASKC
jgi:hypothetical protein